MNNAFSKKSLYAIFISLILLTLFNLGLFYQILKNEQETVKKESQRYESYLLASELKQSSDELTRMARTYTVTGNRLFKDYFQEILDIRDGKKARPKNYHRIYWDFVLARGKESIKGNEFVPLKTLMKKAGFTTEEFLLLENAERLSNELVSLETEAMNAMVGLYKGPSGEYNIKKEADQSYARKILHGLDYHVAKEKIMQPLNEFFESIEKRTKKDILFHYEKRKRLSFVLLVTMIVSIVLIFLSFFLISFGSKKTKNRPFLYFFTNRVWKEWPFMMSSFVIIFMIMGSSWYFLKDIKAAANQNVELVHESTLNKVYYSVYDWLEEVRSEIRHVSKVIKLHIASKYFVEIEKNIFTSFHQKLQSSELLKKDLFTDYFLTNSQGIIASSNLTNLIGKNINSLSITNQEDSFLHKDIHIPNSKGVGREAFLNKIVFRSPLPEGSGFVYFLISSKKRLNQIFKRNFFGKSGDVYMINLFGEFVTKGRWREQVLRKVGKEKKTILGGRVEFKGELTKPALAVKQAKSSDKLRRYQNYLGEYVLGVWRWDNTYGFGVVVESHEKEARSFIKFYERQNLIGVLLALFLIIALTIVFIWNRLKILTINEELNLTYETIKKQKEQMENDLILGQKVQIEMLPAPLSSDYFDLQAYLQPAMIVSGDFYDYSFITEDIVYFSIGDVSGKGVAAALFMSMAKIHLSKGLNAKTQVSELVASVNKELSHNNDNCMFLTLIVCIVNLKTGVMQITNAGHNAPYLKRKKGTFIELSKIDGPLVGTFSDAKFSQQEIKIDSGDTLVLYTDGVVESQNKKKDFYGDVRLHSLLQNSDNFKIVDAIVNDIDVFTDGANQFDDITIVSFKYL